MERDKLYHEIEQLYFDREVVPTTLRMRKDETRKVRARILWPALGFPAVISPDARSTGTPLADGDARTCICVLLLSDQKFLSKEDAANYLRYVSWDDRSRRHIPAGHQGSFAARDIEVRNDSGSPGLRMPGWKDVHGFGIAFGGNRDGEHGVTVKLADYVKNFYQRSGLQYLHEIRIYERASAQLQDGRYNLFWNSDDTKEEAPSPELKLLLDRYALPKRQSLALWNTQPKFLLGEYEYEYGSLQKPYRNDLQMRKQRAEILHPLFVQRLMNNGLTVGHITDTHVSVRSNVYEENLKGANTSAQFNNWNTSFVKAYEAAKKGSDILLLTGDLVDYGRGHWGLTGKDKLGEDRLYHADRNWFLFYYLLASGNSYQKPTYTILGNHDWRLNPYPPFAIAGAPSPTAFFHNHLALDKDVPKGKKRETRRLLEVAHGPGIERKFTYYLATDGAFMKKFWQDGSLLKTVGKLVAQKKTMDEPHLPVETTVESVGWYLMAINPFLDYSFTLPGDEKVLMLDWAEDEDLFFPLVSGGKDWPFMPWDVKKATLPGPKAKNSLTTVQKKMVEDFVGSPGSSKFIGIHTPPIGPYPDWSDADLQSGRKVYGPDERARGPKTYATKRPDGNIEKWNGHPFYAVLPDKGEFGTVADYGSFSKERAWFIKRLADPKSGVRAIFSGHIHRDGLFAVHTPTEKESGPLLNGRMLVKSLLSPASPSDRVRIVGLENFGYRYPLYINTTSAGPRGDFFSRKITSAESDQGGLTIHPGYSLVDVMKGGAVRRVQFLSI